MPQKETYSGSIFAQAQQDLISKGIENLELPRGVVMKIGFRVSPCYHSAVKFIYLNGVFGGISRWNPLFLLQGTVSASKISNTIAAVTALLDNGVFDICLT
jgi:hypothetical protein